VDKQPTKGEDWPLNVTFGASKTGPTTCANGTSWCPERCPSYVDPRNLPNLAADPITELTLTRR